MLTNVKRAYALAEFSVEVRHNGWWFWRTYGDKSEAKGPYSSLASVTLMIARQLRKEVTKRDSVHKLPE